MTQPTTTAAPSAPQPERNPRVGEWIPAGEAAGEGGRWQFAKRFVLEKQNAAVVKTADQGVSVEARTRKHRVRDYDLDPADEDFTPSDGGMMKSAIRASNEAGVKFRQGATWKLWAPWIGFVLLIGLWAYTYGGPRGWFGQSNSAPSANYRGGARDGASAASGGAGTLSRNRSRELLEKWLGDGSIGSMHPAEVAEARAAVQADGGRP